MTDEDDFLDEDDFFAYVADEASREAARTSTSSSGTQTRSLKTTVRNLPVTYPLIIISCCTHNGIRLTPNACVELLGGEFSGDFLKIVEIVKNTVNDEITLRGYLFRRTRALNGVIDKKMNEVCWIIHADDDDSRDPTIQGMEVVNVTDVLKRRTVRMTNQPFPALSWRGNDREAGADVEQNRELVCRYKYICRYPDANARNKYAWCEKGFHRLKKEECDQRVDNNVHDSNLREQWRGTTVLGGAQTGWLLGEKEFLRQEAISHRGERARQSLIALSGRKFPLLDVMKRGSVGQIIRPDDFGESFDEEHTRVYGPSELPVEGDDADVEDMIPSSMVDRAHKRKFHKYRPTTSALGKRHTEPTDNDSNTGADLSSLGRKPRRSSIGIASSEQKSRRVMEINAKVKSSSSSGVLQEQYQGRFTSTYIPPSSLPKERPAEASLTRAPRKPCLDHSAHPITTKDRVMVDPRDDILWDSEETVGRSQAENSDSFIEVRPPLKVRGHETTMGFLHNPQRDQTKILSPKFVGTDSQSKLSCELTAPKIDKDGEGWIDLTKTRTNPFTTNMKSRSALASMTRRDPTVVPSSRSPLGADSNYRRVVPSIGSQTQRPMPNARQQSGFNTEHSSSTRQRKRQQRYTFGDCFCGAGGVSRGAVNTGLRLKWGFDFDEAACEAYSLNFFGTLVYNFWANDFSHANCDFKVDICHMSPPCQYFSGAHTKPGKDDERNTATLFAIGELLEKVKPRIATLEQSAGLLQRHPVWFNKVVNMFTSKGFSIRWRLMQCADFGLAQRRLRLFIIAACPGEVLPSFPKPTHSEHPARTGLKPWLTINEAIANIPRGWYNHDPEGAIKRDSMPQDGNIILPCITTSGTTRVHPSGKRDFTLRELACAQSLPLGHKFGETGIKKQIGNMVPPIMATPVLEEVQKALLKVDGFV